MKGFCLFCVINCIAAFSWAATSWEAHNSKGFSIQASIPQETILIIDDLPITLQLSYPQGYKPDIAILRTHLLQYGGVGEPPFSLTSEKVEPAKKENDVLKQKVTFTLSPQIAGDHQLTFFDIPFQSDDQKKNSSVILISDIFDIHVIKPTGEVSLDSIHPPLMKLSPAIPIDINPSNRQELIYNKQRLSNESERNQKIFNEKSIPWFAILLLISGLLFVIISSKRKHADHLTEVKKSINLKRQALQDLNLLDKKDYLSQNKYSEFYDELSMILRRAIEGQYNVKVTTLSTEEFLHDLVIHPIFSEDTRQSLEEILLRIDQIKYGRLESTQKESASILKLSEKFIRSFK